MHTHNYMQYIPPQNIHPSMFLKIQGFTLIISDNQTTRRLFLSGAQVRNYSFNSSFLQAANFTENTKTIWVVAETAAETISSSESFPFSGTTHNLMQSLCIHAWRLFYVCEMVTVNTVSDIFKFSSHIILQMDELIAGIDLRQVLTKEQCVQVSINSFCTESAASFQVQLRFSRGFCEENASQTIIPYRQTTRHCIHTKSISNCFSVVVFNDEGVEISASD